jgi:hypothetical protein
MEADLAVLRFRCGRNSRPHRCLDGHNFFSGQVQTGGAMINPK